MSLGTGHETAFGEQDRHKSIWNHGLLWSITEKRLGAEPDVHAAWHSFTIRRFYIS
jgi:hypothetical protein